MVAPVIKTAFYRCFLPIVLITAGCLRPSLISAVYVGLGLLCPLLPSTKNSLNAVPVSVRATIVLLLLITICASIGQVTYQVINRKLPDEQYVKNCEANQTVTLVLRLIGYEKFSLRPLGKPFAAESLHLILPEAISLLGTAITAVIVLALRHSTILTGSETNVQVVRSSSAAPRVDTPWLSTALGDTLRRASNMIIVILIGATSCVQPSLLSAPYFFVFLFLLTWYAMHKSIQHECLNRIKQFVILYSAFHFFLIFVYQIPAVGDRIPSEGLVAKLLGLTTILKFDCVQWYKFGNPGLLDNEWPFKANPVAILVLFQLTIWQYSFTKHGTHRFTRIDHGGDDGSSVHEELLGDSDEEGDERASNGMPLKKITSQVIDRQRITQIFNGPSAQKSVASRGLIMVITFFFSQAYVVGLIAMMTWSLLYHSIFGLILLLAACVIWIFPNSRRASFRFAPVILAYVEFLLILQYICSMNIQSDWEAFIKGEGRSKEFWKEVTSWLQTVGAIFAVNPVQAVVVLMVKMCLALPISLMLRLARRDRKFEALNEAEKARRLANYGTFASISQFEQTNNARAESAQAKRRTPSSVKLLFAGLSRLLVSLWLPVVFVVLIFASVWGKACFFTIGYLGFFVGSIIVFKTSFTLFRATHFLILTLLTAYTSVVIIVLYCYQFPNVVTYIDKHLRKPWPEAIGFESGDKAPSLFTRLAPSILLYIVTMLQLKFFHNQWKALTDPCSSMNAAAAVDSARPSVSSIAAEGAERGRKKKKFNEKVGKVVGDVIDVMWRIAEVHISKGVFLLIIALVCTTDNYPMFVTKAKVEATPMKPYAIYVPLMVLISLAVCLPKKAASLCSILVCAYLAAVAVCKMIFQLPFFTVNFGPGVQCANTTEFGNATFIEWLGFTKMPNQTWSLIQDLIVSILLLAIQSVVFYRRAFSRAQAEAAGAPPENTSSRYVCFPEQSPQSLDRDLPSFCKWLIDYAFYKFGVEVSIIMMAIHIWVRMDAIAVMTSAFIIVIVLSPRPLVRALWPILLIYLAVLLPLQYALHVGFPPPLCISYPWAQWGLEWMRPVGALFNLSLYNTFWTGGFFISDFLALVAVASQLYVFGEESDEHPAGNNKSIYIGREYVILPDNPHYDYIAKQRSFVDYAKICIFQYGHWITLLMVLIAGLGGTSLFALGYIVLSLSMLWEGNNLYLMKNHRRTLFRWKLVLAYTAVVIMLKTGLQLIACTLNVSPCALKQLFAIRCVSKNVLINEMEPSLNGDNDCKVDEAESNIGLDTFALGFILFQMRVFCSWYFQYVITEFRSEIVLSNRGAVLSNQLIEKEMKEQEEQQSKKFDDIRDRTKMIRARYEQLQKDQDRTDIIEPETYGAAKRAGDYYMFDYDPSQDELKKDKETFVPEVDPGASDFNKLDPTQLAYAAVTKDLDMKETLESASKAEKAVEGGEMSKRKMMEDVVTPKYRASMSGGETSGVSSGAEEPPTTSTAVVIRRGDGEESDEEEEDETQSESKLVYFARFGLKMFTNTLDWISAFLNRRSREHRYVAYVLSQERTKLKEKKGESLNDVSRRLSDLHNDAKSERGLMVVQSESDIEKMEEAAINSWQKQHVLARLTNAIGYCIGAHTDVVCYLLAILCHARGAGLITLPLPLMVFFWGTLSNPRPSKFFWVAMILCTEAIVVVKFVFQFGFWNWNKLASMTNELNNQYYWNKVLGVQKKDFYPGYEVALLMALFFHRYMLRKLGLWKDANVSETFDGELTLSERTRVEGVTNPAMDASSSSSAQSGTGEATVHGGEVTTTAADAEGNEVDGGEADKERTGLNRFIYQLFYPKFRYIRDLYPSMFGLDIICFLIVVFGYSAFGDGGSGSVVNDIQSNRVPLAFVIMMIVSSFMIVIDRGLYLRKAIRCKLVYQFIIVIFMHVWIFFVLPAVTKKAAVDNGTAQGLYFVKGVYLLVSAWQIRNGYPQLCVGNLLMHSYGLANMVFYKVFMAAPFVWELRTAIDWTWTDTSMPLFDFFNMETFYSTIYNLKCARAFEAAYPAPRGEKKGAMVKYMMGLPFVIFIVLLIWCPLLAFSLLNKVGKALPPQQVTLSVAIEGYPPLYTIEAQGRELIPFTDHNFAELKSRYAAWSTSAPDFLKKSPTNDVVTKARQAVSYLDDYAYNDVMTIRFRPESQTKWPISEPSMEALLADLIALDYDGGSDSLNINVNIELVRERENSNKEPVKHTAAFSSRVTDELRKRLITSLNGTAEENCRIQFALPRFITVPNEGEITDAKLLLLPAIEGDKAVMAYSDINLRFHKSSAMWTGQLRSNNLTNAIDKLAPEPGKTTYPSQFGPLDYIEVTGMVDRVFPSVLSKFVSGGIIAMYIALVLFIGKMIRGVLTNSPTNVMITEIPNPDHLLKICLDIYLVREARDFVLEQDLFAKLIFLFRSPATLIKWTRLRPKAKAE